MLELLLILILVGVIVGFVVLFQLLKKQGTQTNDPALLMLQQQLQELQRGMDSKLGDSTKAIQQHFGESSRIIREITQELVRVGEGQKQVLNVTDQLKSLQDILKNPKQRGVLGEYYLETVLKNVLPPGSYKLQYPFKNGDIVDAVIFYEDKIIPIDSKFSLENYNRILSAQTDEERKRYEDALRGDLKNRIDETSKYVKPGENTIDFAFMFIPSEALYYDLLVNKVGSVNARDLIEYATMEKRVVVVSPTSFLAYLQTVIQGLRQIEFNKSAAHIQKNVGELGKHLIQFDAYMQKMGKSLETTVGMYNKANHEFKKIDKDVLRVTGEAMKIEPLVIEGIVKDTEREQEETLF